MHISLKRIFSDYIQTLTSVMQKKYDKKIPQCLGNKYNETNYELELLRKTCVPMRIHLQAQQKHKQEMPNSKSSQRGKKKDFTNLAVAYQQMTI